MHYVSAPPMGATEEHESIILGNVFKIPAAESISAQNTITCRRNLKK